MSGSGAGGLPSEPFTLDPAFLATYAGVPPPFGFNGLGEFVYHTRYARVLPGDPVSGVPARHEAWWECVARVVHGTFNMQRRWIESQGLGWDGACARACVCAGVWRECMEL